MRNAISFLLGLILLIASCVSIEDKPRSNEIAGSYHQVKPGDTVGKIATLYHVSAHEIMDINGIDDERNLKIGQWLFLPNLDPIGATIAKLQKKQPSAEPAKKPNSKTPVAISKPLLAFPLPAGKIFRSFSRDKRNPYDGIGIEGKLGSPVVAAADGKVLFVGDEGTKFGLVVLIEHEKNLITVYTHLQKAHISAGQVVKKNSAIGLLGQSGGVKTPRLHFQVRLNQRVQDPKLYLKNTP